MSDKMIHTVQLAMVLATALALILFAHAWVDPLIVFTSMIAGVSGIIGTRIASNGYVSAPQTVPPAPIPTITTPHQGVTQ